jgi:hypothetical protein
MPLAKEGKIPFFNLFTGDRVLEQMAIKVSKAARAKGLIQQLVENPIAAPADVLVDYQRMAPPAEADGFWRTTQEDAGAEGRTRLAETDANVDGARATLTFDGKDGFMEATSIAEVEKLLRDPAVFPLFVDMFVIPREILKDQKALASLYESPDLINSLEFRGWEVRFDGKHVVIPGEPVMVQRVPSDNVYSASVVRLKNRIKGPDGTTPNVIMTSMSRQIAAGSDFDIDKRFVMLVSRANAEGFKWMTEEQKQAYRQYAAHTFNIPSDAVNQDKTYGGYKLNSKRDYAYNRAMLGLVSVFESPENYGRIVNSMDHDSSQAFFDHAKEVQGDRLSDDVSESPFTPQGATRIYKLNSVGKKGLGRAANSMFSANVMIGLGYGFAKDQSFEFTPEGATEPVQIVMNRKAGDRGGFAATKDMIGLVLNKYTDHTKLQEIDKIGGDVSTASLFALLLYALHLEATRNA